ncbi:hypothetical protein DPMN_161289 [Dreissena polymorpha]|uniref:Core-binding (CB) domain-containing protein n=1 Tax=Dreissena polymorpha TaxID=45954 RepID=A0A9D4ISJ4_DREPO|nr:hypothetical protein DPMN_161289 [Dreissena polymorpha]
MGSAHHRQIRELSQCAGSALQQQILGTNVRSCRRTFSGQLALREQFCQRAVLSATQSLRCNSRSTRSSNSHCAKMVSSTMVQSPGQNVRRTAVKSPEQPAGVSVDGCSGTLPEPVMGTFRLENFWKFDLELRGWSINCINRFRFCLAPSTLNSNNGALEKLHSFCRERNCKFPPLDVSLVAEYLASLSKNSERPRSVLNNAISALGHVYRL